MTKYNIPTDTLLSFKMEYKMFIDWLFAGYKKISFL